MKLRAGEECARDVRVLDRLRIDHERPHMPKSPDVGLLGLKELGMLLRVNEYRNVLPRFDLLLHPQLANRGDDINKYLKLLTRSYPFALSKSNVYRPRMFNKNIGIFMF